MQYSDTLTDLAERAAQAVTMLSGSDLSDAADLQEILNKINAALAQMDKAPMELLREAEGTIGGAQEVLEQLLQHQVDDAGHAVNVVSQAVATIQDLIRQVTTPAVQPALQPAMNHPAKQADSSSVQHLVIPEEDAPLVMDFIAEANEHLGSAETALLDLENKPGDQETLNKVFRAFHTIKGMAGFLNLTEIGRLAHSSENLLDMVRKGQLTLTGAYTDIVFKTIDMLKDMNAVLKNAIEHGIPVESQKDLQQLLAILENAAKGETAAPLQAQALTDNRDKTLENTLRSEDGSGAGPAAANANTHVGDDKIKVSTTRLDNLINMTGELVIAELMVAEEVAGTHAAHHQMTRKVAHLSKIVREIQGLSMSMRMVPIQGVFQKMARLARDLSCKSAKKIDFRTVGEETELDRNIVDKIADPLVHMVRNSIDHGIESPEHRKEAGKNPIGTVELRAFHQAGNIVIEIEDDGKGLDKHRILEKAVEAKLVEPGQDLTDEQIFKLIFHAGLTTAEKVTEVSGRGVGMDVVRRNIESLRGKIDIRSTPGRGTVFTIRLPLTLAILDGQVVRVGRDRYIIPIKCIVQSFRPDAKQVTFVQNRAEMVMVRGELVPLVHVDRLFGITADARNMSKGLMVLVEENNEKCCLLIDELLGQQQVVVKSLGEGLCKVKGFSGGSIMGDGRVSLILDVPGLIELSRC